MLTHVYHTARQHAAAVDRGAPITTVSWCLASEHRPIWMTDDQWHQVIRWIRGESVPTDEELVRALQMEGDVNDPVGRDRGSYWAYRSIGGSVVGAVNVQNWSALIQRYADPDLLMDIGL